MNADFTNNAKWIGDIPKNWEIKRVKDICQIKKGKAVETFLEKSEGMLPCIDTNLLRGRENIVFSKTGIKIIPNKVLILWDGANAGELFFNKNIGYLGSTFGVINTKLNNNFLFYYLKGIEQYSKDNLTGMGIPHVDGNVLRQTSVFIPPKDQQTAIANYLDIETTKIDNKISILEQKFDKLEEYKQSIIFETVTKGLDKNVAMKDSGIDWIGDIPEHWQMKRVKEVAKWQTGFTPDTKKAAYYEGNSNWITIGDMEGKYVGESKNKINGMIFPKNWITPKNSLLFSFKLSIGQVAFTKKEVFTNEAICSFSPKSKIDLDYFYYAAPIFIVKNAKKNIYNADLLNQELISNAYIVDLNKEEQKEITNYLNTFTAKIDKKKEIIKKQINLLKELKQSVIFEAVTGKLNIGANIMNKYVIKDILAAIQNIGLNEEKNKIKNKYNLSLEELEDYFNYCEREGLTFNKAIYSNSGEICRYTPIITQSGKDFLYNSER